MKDVCGDDKCCDDKNDTIGSLIDELEKYIPNIARIGEVAESHANMIAGTRPLEDDGDDADEPKRTVPNGHVERLREIMNGLRREIANAARHLSRIGNAI